jgi:hypothetical protein
VAVAGVGAVAVAGAVRRSAREGIEEEEKNGNVGVVLEEGEIELNKT